MSTTNVWSSKPQVWTLFLVLNPPQEAVTAALRVYPTQTACGEQVNHLWAGALSHSVKVGVSPPFSDNWEGCRELGPMTNQPWAKEALHSQRIGFHRWRQPTCPVTRPGLRITLVSSSHEGVNLVVRMWRESFCSFKVQVERARFSKDGLSDSVCLSMTAYT